MKTNKLKQQKGTLLRVLQYVKPYRVLVIVSLLCACVSAAAQLLIPILTGKAIDQMLGAGQVNLSGVLVFAVWIAVVAALSAIAQQFLATSNNKIAYNISRDLRNAAFHKLQRLPLSYLDAHPSGDLVSRMIADVDTFSDGLLMGFTQLFTGVVLIVGTLTIMLIKNWMIALLVVVLTPLSMFVASFIARKTHHYFTEQARVRGQQTALINELIEGQKVVQSFGHEAASLSDFDCINDELGRVSLNATFFSSLTNPSTRLVNNIIYAAVALVGALSAVGGGISVGDLSVFLSYASQYAKPFNEISGVVTELQNALACAARVFSLLDEDDRVPDKENAAVLSPKGTVDLKDVCFRYVPDRPLIEGFNLHVKPGQRIAIVGPTGCGKTTMINLLMRFYDVNSGAILVDGTDIRDAIVADADWIQQNVGAARITGFESALHQEWFGWQSSLGVAIIDPRDRDTGKTLSRRARRTLNLDLDRQFDRIGVGASWQAVSSSYNDEQNQQPLGGYALLGVRANWLATSEVRLDLKVDNLLDKTFTRALYSYEGDYYGYREERRSVQLAVTWTPRL